MITILSCLLVATMAICLVLVWVDVKDMDARLKRINDKQ